MAEKKTAQAVDVGEESVTGPVEHRALSAMGGTFAERKAANEQAAKKAVQPSSTQNKAVTSAESK